MIIIILILFLTSCSGGYDASKDKSRDFCIYHNYNDGKNHCDRFNLIKK